LGLEPGIAGVDVISGSTRDEDCTFVGDVTVDGRKFDEFARREQMQGVILDEIVVEGRVVGEEGISRCVGKAGENIIGLQSCNVEFAETG